GTGAVVQRFWLKTFDALAGRVRLEAICSGRLASAEALAAQRPGLRVLADAQALAADAAVDALLICSPPDLHRAQAETALAAGKPVLVEKPLTACYDETVVLLRSAQAASVPFMATFNNLYRDNNAWLRRAVLEGAVGTLERVDIRWLREMLPETHDWLYQAERSGGGVMADIGIHVFINALALVPTRGGFRLDCRTESRSAVSGPAEDWAEVRLTIDDGPQMHFTLGWGLTLGQPVDFAFTAEGTGGALSTVEFKGPVDDGYRRLFERFLTLVETGGRADLDLYHDSMLILDACYRSAASGAAVSGHFGLPSG
ncbi:MAG: Gfo/Idh/MocA family protein, partial [Rhodospirillales bacterium]